MTPPGKRSSSPLVAGGILILAASALVAVVWLGTRRPESQAVRPAESEAQSTGASTSLPAASVVTNAVNPDAARFAGVAPANYPDFQPRPLPVAVESDCFQWSSADAKATNIIRQIAHNDLEYQRMVEENSRIQRRQLVYSKNTAAAVLQQARLSGESVTRLTLPGFDGREFQFAVERADLEPSKQSGTFAGQLVGRPNSLVTLAFKFGREAFTIVSPEDGIYLQGHPREPGQIIVTSFDPDTYLPLPCGEPIKTSK